MNIASGMYAIRVNGTPSIDVRGFCPRLRLFAINPAVKPVRAFPSGNPIRPNHPPVPTGPNIIPGRIPAMTPVDTPAIGPAKKPAMSTAISEKSNATPGAIGAAKYDIANRTFPSAPIIIMNEICLAFIFCFLVCLSCRLAI